MRYRIEYMDGRYCTFAKDGADLVARLELEKPGAVSDIRKLYKGGISDSVLEKYARYIG